MMLRAEPIAAVTEDDFAARWAPRQPAKPPRGVSLGLALCMPVWVALGGLLYSFTF